MPCNSIYGPQSFSLEIVANGVIVREHGRGLTFVFAELGSALNFIRDNVK